MEPMDGQEGLTTNKTVHVLIVDDQLPFRAVARTVIGLTAGFEVTAEAASGEEAIESVNASAPDLVLMDINMPGMNGIDASCRIKELHPEVEIVLLSTYNEADLPADARECGAIAYVHKEDFAPALIRQLWDGRSSNA
jgi:two-component system invasion response regulator UvrY